MAQDLIIGQEKNFIQEYHAKLKVLQNTIPDDWTYYTKVTISTAVLNNFYELNVLFHPQSLSKHKTWSKPAISDKELKETLQDIITYELSTESWLLSQIELEKTILLFRKIEQKL